MQQRPDTRTPERCRVPVNNNCSAGANGVSFFSLPSQRRIELEHRGWRHVEFDYLVSCRCAEVYNSGLAALNN